MVTKETTKPSLNQQQEDFTIGILNGMTNRDAYIEAYHPVDSNMDTIDAAASRLLSNVKIQARLDKLRKPKADRVVMNRTARQQVLAAVANHSIEKPVSAAHKLAAIDILNKMDGEYKPDQTNIYVNKVDITLVRNKVEALITRLAGNIDKQTPVLLTEGDVTTPEVEAPPC